MDYSAVLENQNAFFKTGTTLPLAYRRTVLDMLEQAIKSHVPQIEEALRLDLGKSASESYLTEIAMVLSEIRFARKSLPSWMAPQKVRTPLSHQPGRQSFRPIPLGSVLILSPWNYPFQLCMSPLVSAIAAGNCAVVKPSELAEHTAQIIETLLSDLFDPGYIAVCQGGANEASALTGLPFAKIFFTGSGAVAKKVLASAAEHLTPVALELGGKSPCIVDQTADLDLAAKRIMWGKILNCGQTCVAPDYVLIHRSVKDAFVGRCQAFIEEFLGADPLASADYGHLINEKHYQRVLSLLEGCSILIGGKCDPEKRSIAPTLIGEPSLESPIMEQEIFGPLLPVLCFDTLEQAVDIVQRNPHPLAAYFFSRDRESIAFLQGSFSYGDGCVNDTIMHLASPYLPFGGVGTSGTGQSHGKFGFLTFSHIQGNYEHTGRWEPSLRYPPYTKRKGRILRKIT